MTARFSKVILVPAFYFKYFSCFHLHKYISGALCSSSVPNLVPVSSDLSAHCPAGQDHKARTHKHMHTQTHTHTQSCAEKQTVLSETSCHADSENSYFCDLSGLPSMERSWHPEEVANWSASGDKHGLYHFSIHWTQQNTVMCTGAHIYIGQNHYHPLRRAG